MSLFINLNGNGNIAISKRIFRFIKPFDVLGLTCFCAGDAQFIRPVYLRGTQTGGGEAGSGQASTGGV